MVVDHIKYAFPLQTWNNFTLYFGRIAFPLFLFCSVQGYVHTSNFNKYMKRIFIAAIISQIPFALFNKLPTLDRFELNVMVTIFLGLLAIKLYETANNEFLKFFSVTVMAVLASILKTDYGAYGVLLMFALYITKESKIKTAILFIIVVTSRYLIFLIKYYFTSVDYFIKMWLCTLIPLVFIVLYNGKKGPKLQKFYYWFYPVHLMIFYLASPYTYNWFNL
jgi:hypothetical protein